MKQINKKIIVSILMALTLVFGCVSPAFAESADTADTDVSTDTDTELFEAIDTDIILSTEPGISTASTGEFNLTTEEFNMIDQGTSYSKITYTITNGSASKGGILVRAIDNTATVISGTVVGIPKGSTSTVVIPKGYDYELQVRAVGTAGTSGTYYITISKS